MTVDIEPSRRLTEERSAIVGGARPLGRGGIAVGRRRRRRRGRPTRTSADSASETLDREIELSLEDNADHLLAAIDAALARIDAGTYGMCERCGEPIEHERLEALPYATKCIECKRLEERG